MHLFDSDCSMQAREAGQSTSDEWEKVHAIDDEEEVTSRDYSVNNDYDLGGKNGISCETNQPPEPSNSGKPVTGGMARRIRLAVNGSPGSVANSNVSDTKYGQEDKVKSSITEVRIICEPRQAFPVICLNQILNRVVLFHAGQRNHRGNSSPQRAGGKVSSSEVGCEPENC